MFFSFYVKSVLFAYISSQLCFLRHFVILYDLITVIEVYAIKNITK